MSVFDKLVNTDNLKTIEDLVPNTPKDALELIESCLKFRPSHRITADEALKHEFVREFHEMYPKQEVKCFRKMNMPTGIDDNKKADKKVYFG